MVQIGAGLCAHVLLSFEPYYLLHRFQAVRDPGRRRQRGTQAMSARRSAGWAVAAVILIAMFANSAAAAQIGVRFTLDFAFEGPSAPFLVPLDKGYYRAEGL